MKVLEGKGVRIVLFFVLIYFVILPVALHASVTLNSSLSVTETYTDNLFFDTSSNKQDDFGTFIIPSFTLAYLSKDVELSGSYSGIAQFYVNNTSANAYSHNANFAIDLPFLTKRYKGLEVQLIESFNFSPQLQGFAFSGQPGDEDAASAFRTTSGGGGAIGGGGISGINGSQLGGTNIGNQGVFTRRGTNAFQNIAGITARYALSPRWTPSFRYINNYVTFTDSQLNDSLTHQIGVGLGYRISPKTQVTGNYSATISSISGGDSFVTHNVTVGGSHRLSQTLNMSGSAGVSFTESVEQVTFTTNASIAKVFSRGSVSLSFGQGITPGSGVASGATLSRILVGTVNYTISKRVSGFLSGGWSQNETLSGNSVDVTSYQGQAGLSVALLSWLDGTISYSYIKQESNGTSIAARSATVNQGFLGLTATLPEWKIVK